MKLLVWCTVAIGDKTLDESLPNLNYENWKQWSKNMVGKELQLNFLVLK